MKNQIKISHKGSITRVFPSIGFVESYNNNESYEFSNNSKLKLKTGDIVSFDLKAKDKGFVLNPNSEIMRIVPDNDLEAIVYINSRDIIIAGKIIKYEFFKKLINYFQKLVISYLPFLYLLPLKVFS